jgi:hypothetical protein
MLTGSYIDVRECSQWWRKRLTAALLDDEIEDTLGRHTALTIDFYF